MVYYSVFSGKTHFFGMKVKQLLNFLNKQFSV